MTAAAPEEYARRSGALLTIDLDALAANYRLLAERAGTAECAVAVKADAYGTGMALAAPVFARAGARTFFVADLNEALELRSLLPDAAIGVFNGLMPGCEADYAAHDLLPVLNHLGDVERWAAHASGREAPLPAFLHIDTGMNRLGLGPDELDILVDETDRLAGIDLRAIMSHLACAEDAADPMSEEQRDSFCAALERLPAAPTSLANSSGIFRGPDFHFDMVRPGCALYGVNPTPDAANPMRRVVGLSAKVLQVRNVDTPMTVGYGATHRVAQAAKIATIAVGYADGYLRSLSGCGQVSFAGHPAPVVGRVSMDLITVDVTDVPEDATRPGMMAEIIGDRRDADQVAAEAGTIGYEILTALGRRYARTTIGAGA